MSHLPDVPGLPSFWRTKAADFRRYGLEESARLAEAFIDDLVGAMQRSGDRLLDLRTAAQESGYSADHLSRMLREGKIPNVGRKSRPLIRRRDLPVKARKREEEPCDSSRSGYVPDRLFRDIIHSKLGADDAQD